jgi:hypothetical protein
LAAILGCAVGAAAQSVRAKIADAAESSSLPIRVTKFEYAAESPAAPSGLTAAIPDGPATVPDTGDAPPSDNPAPNAFTAVPHQKSPADNFQWRPAFRQYCLEIAIQHGWRFLHEPGTRAATAYGPWFQDWINSIGETRGWDDGDGWHAGFVGHPLNGAIYGFIERQNDPLYRQVEWGDGNIYWMSLVRSTAFAAIASTQWTLGPVSEASLGNVQLHASPGFIDLVTTPGLGVCDDGRGHDRSLLHRPARESHRQSMADSSGPQPGQSRAQLRQPYGFQAGLAS